MEKQTEMESVAPQKQAFDWQTTLVPVILTALGLWGCLVIYNATYYHSEANFASRQLIWLAIGVGVYAAASNIPFENYIRHALILSTAAWLLLAVVLLCGARINGMRGWFDFGSFYIQPSELAKPFFILTLCMAGRKAKNELSRYARMLLLTCLWTAPIIAEPDLGTVLIFGAGFAVLYWTSGGRLSFLLATLLLMAPAAAAYIHYSKYIPSRIIGFAAPFSDPLGSGWHTCQFRYTLARGGLFGTNWGEAVWANTYLPLAHSDSSFAALVETFGLAGALPVIAGVLVLLFIGRRLSLRAPDEPTAWLVFSIPAMFAAQSLLHISVNATLLPPTGITLPIFSYGGSSLVSTMLAFGMVVSAAKSKKTFAENMALK